MHRYMLFIQGAGSGAYAEYRLLAASLQSALGAEYEVQCPPMPDEENSHLCEQDPAPRVAGLFVIAAPFWGASAGWQWDEGTLPADAASRLAGSWPLVFYHSRDDEVVPFEHLALYAAKLPRATIRALDQGGHQFGNDLSEVAADIKERLNLR
jgi:serine hydrolase